MGAKIGDGKKYIRDFAVDFTDKETYIGGKSFPKGYFTAALLNYGKDLVTRMLIAGGHCFQALRALELQTFTLEQFDTLVRITMDIHRDLFKCEPFCHLDVLAEESTLNALFSSSVRDSLSAYYDLAVQYSGYERAELQLSDEELRAEQQGMILEADRCHAHLRHVQSQRIFRNLFDPLFPTPKSRLSLQNHRTRSGRHGHL